MGLIEGGGGPQGGVRLFGGSQNFAGPVLRHFKCIIGTLSSSPVDWHPFGANWIEGGVCVHGTSQD